ncbi:MAG: glycosyltransferase family 1 protein [Anaerolineae bacterium]
MRLTIDYTPAIQHHAGIGRYADELTRALLALNTGDELRLFYTDPLNRTPTAPLDRLPRRVLDQANKPWRLKVLLSALVHRSLDPVIDPDADIFHATDHLLPPLRRARSVFTLYDLTFVKFPDVHLPLNRWYSQLMVPYGLRAANAVLAISECTKRDAETLYRLPTDRIRVVPLGVEARFKPIEPLQANVVREQYHLPQRFILAVGTIEPRKNLITLLEAYQLISKHIPDLQLVIVGKRGWRAESFFTRLHELGLENRVIFPGFVPDVDLPAIYSLAAVLAFPSIYEGFGLPVLEAMACGTPVVCSNTSSLPEIAGEAAVQLPPDDGRSWIQALERVLTDVPLAADLRQRGLKQAMRFTWKITARQTHAIYQEINADRS